MTLPAVRPNSIKAYKRGARLRVPLQLMSYMISLNIVTIESCRIQPGHVLFQTTYALFILYMTNKFGSPLPHRSVVLHSVKTNLEVMKSTEIKTILFYHKCCSLRSIIDRKQWRMPQRKMNKHRRSIRPKPRRIKSKRKNICQTDFISRQKRRNSNRKFFSKYENPPRSLGDKSQAKTQKSSAAD